MLDWRELVHLSDAELDRLDIAEVNLACAAGLPGSERIDVDYCLRSLDSWAETVRRYTDLAYHQFFLTNPAHYENSEPLFRMASLVNDLQRHCGVRYDETKIGAGPETPFDFEDEFIHGVIQGPGGTCATLPVVYAAVGRRLGYPIRLVCTMRHQFCRWDDPAAGKRFNIESGIRGMNSFPDDYYRTWPVSVRVGEVTGFGFLQSLTPQQELASFISTRAFRLQDAHQFLEALNTFFEAWALDQANNLHSIRIVQLLSEWKVNVHRRCPPGFPLQIDVNMGSKRRNWPLVPWEVEREIASVHATEVCLDDPRHVEWWWNPLREGRLPMSEVPTSIEVNYETLVNP